MIKLSIGLSGQLIHNKKADYIISIGARSGIRSRKPGRQKYAMVNIMSDTMTIKDKIMKLQAFFLWVLTQLHDIKKADYIVSFGARSGIRTHTYLRTLEPESSESASSTILARI